MSGAQSPGTKGGGTLTEDVDLEYFAILFGQEADGLQGKVFVDGIDMAEEGDGWGARDRGGHGKRDRGGWRFSG